MAAPLRKIINIIIITVIFAVNPLIHQTKGCAAELARKYVRVLILDNASSLNLSIKGFFKITDPKSGRVLFKGKQLYSTVRVGPSGITIRGINYPLDKLMVEAVDPESMAINNRAFRGNYEFIKKDDHRLCVINFIDLEDYIKGILYQEASHYWPQDALKAQGIACRTYALYQIQENSLKDFDATSDIYSQVYGGKSSERYRTNMAVDETKEEALTYRGKVFPAYFHATCAGHTEDAQLLWNINLPPLKGVVCAYCKGSPHFSWHEVLSLKQIMEALIKSGNKEYANIRNILVLGRDNSGRITDLKIESSRGDFKLPAKDFRIALGPNVIKSTNFKVEIVSSDAVFEGIGWGHGVGLCQWGAYFMAKQGFNYKQILQYYYPYSEITKIK